MNKIVDLDRLDYFNSKLKNEFASKSNTYTKSEVDSLVVDDDEPLTIEEISELINF